MALFLYGLIQASEAPALPALHGLDHAVVRAVEAGALAALVSELSRAPDRGSLVDVKAHDAVLRGAVEAGIATVASRFGQTFASDDAVRVAVGDVSPRVGALLRDHADCVEMRVLLPGSVASGFVRPRVSPNRERGPGTAYLEQARARVAGPDLTLLDALPGLVQAERAESLAGGRGAAVAHLVRRADIPAYRHAIAHIPGLAGASVVGPLPFHSFSGGGSEP